jgi:spermidine synthase
MSHNGEAAIAHPYWWLEQSDGATLLMTDLGAFSIYHPTHVFTGRGWDAQVAITYFLASTPRDILLLGLGGGTAARQFRTLYPRARIVAVEIDASVVDVAKRSFDLLASDVEVVCASAETYVAKSTRRFDVIIDDAWPFGCQAARSASVDTEWPEKLRRRLRHDGVVGINLYSASRDAATRSTVIARLKEVWSCIREAGFSGRLTTVLAAGEALSNGHQARRAMQAAVPFAHECWTDLRFRSL